MTYSLGQKCLISHFKMLRFIFCGALMLLFSHSSIAQNEGQSFPRLQIFETNEKMFSGQIDGQEITVFLEKVRTGNYSFSHYSIKGWYWYNVFQKKFQL